MAYLLDTNILLRFADRRDPQHPEIRRALATLHRAGETLWIAPQNCVELWNAATRPVQKNGFGLKPADVEHLLATLERLFPRLQETPALYPAWRHLVQQHQVSGVQVHDARLVAIMLVHRITHLLTLNTKDFIRYSEISCLTPGEVGDG